MSQKQILVVPPDSKLTKAERDDLREAGIIVITLRTPHQARLLTAERLPLDSNDLLRATMKAIAASNGSYSEGLRLSIMESIAKAICANNESKD